MNHKGNIDIEFVFMWFPDIIARSLRRCFQEGVLWYLGLKKCHSWGWCDTGYCVFSPTTACRIVALQEKVMRFPKLESSHEGLWQPLKGWNYFSRELQVSMRTEHKKWVDNSWTHLSYFLGTFMSERAGWDYVLIYGERRSCPV